MSLFPPVLPLSGLAPFDGPRLRPVNQGGPVVPVSDGAGSRVSGPPVLPGALPLPAQRTYDDANYSSPFEVTDSIGVASRLLVDAPWADVRTYCEAAARRLARRMSGLL